MWTEERVGTLTRLWSDGLSGAEIAKRLGGVTRMAVLGKVHRLQLPTRSVKTSSRKRPSDPRSRPGGSRYSERRELRIKRSGSGLHTFLARIGSVDGPVIPMDTVVPEPESMNLTLMDLQPGHCRWAHGDKPFLFCGHPVEDEQSYCQHHFARSIQPDWRRKSMKRRDENYFASL